MVMISGFAEDAATSRPDVSSRRALLGRLAGLGLVAAGGLALVPDEAEAKRKPRRQRRRVKPAPKKSGKVSAQVVRDHRTPKVRDQRSPALRPKTQLEIVSIGGDSVQVTISGTLTFTDIHLASMKRGTRYSLTAELWDDDDWTSYAGDDTMINDDDYCNSIWTPGKGLQRLVWPTNPANPAKTVPVLFRQNMHRSFLDRDPIGETEVYGRLMSWLDSGKGWVHLGDSYTLNIIHREFDGWI